MNQPSPVPPSPSRSETLRRLAREAGFDAAGTVMASSLEGGEEARRFRDWLARGRQALMAYMARAPERRLDPARVLPGVRSILCVALAYEPAPADPPRPGIGRIARYARGRDYHKVFRRSLADLDRRLAAEFPGIATRSYVDTGPVLEKLWAERAGLGWRGKHTNLVSRSAGSWFLLGEVLLDLELEPDAPETDHCGTCTRCLDACPTGAFPAPYTLDAGRCISYLTIEHRGPIPVELRPLLGDRVFGCDDCLEACPWNRFAREARVADFRPRPETTSPLLADLVRLDDAGFLRRFAGTAIMRAKREGLARNACVALGNAGDRDAVPVLVQALGDSSALVREHAAWALARLAERGVIPEDDAGRARAESAASPRGPTPPRRGR